MDIGENSRKETADQKMQKIKKSLKELKIKIYQIKLRKMELDMMNAEIKERISRSAKLLESCNKKNN